MGGLEMVVGNWTRWGCDAWFLWVWVFGDGCGSGRRVIN